MNDTHHQYKLTTVQCKGCHWCRQALWTVCGQTNWSEVTD